MRKEIDAAVEQARKNIREVKEQEADAAAELIMQMEKKFGVELIRGFMFPTHNAEEELTYLIEEYARYDVPINLIKDAYEAIDLEKFTEEKIENPAMTTTQAMAKGLTEPMTCSVACTQCSDRVWFQGNMDQQHPEYTCPYCGSVEYNKNLGPRF